VDARESYVCCKKNIGFIIFTRLMRISTDNHRNLIGKCDQQKTKWTEKSIKFYPPKLQTTFPSFSQMLLFYCHVLFKLNFSLLFTPTISIKYSQYFLSFSNYQKKLNYFKLSSFPVSVFQKHSSI